MFAERKGGLRAALRRTTRWTRQASLLGAIAFAPQTSLEPTQGPSPEDANGPATRVSPTPERPTRVLVLYALAPESPTSAVFLARLRTTLRSELAAPMEVFEEFVDLDRFAAPERWHRFARFYGDKYRSQPPDIIVAIGLVALEFAVDRLRSIMPGVPIVFGMTYAHRVDVAALPPNVTGRTLRMTLGRSLTMAMRLQPKADRVVAITGASRVDSIGLTDALADAAAEYPSIRVERWQGFPYDSLLRAVRGLTPRTIVYFVYFRRDGRGRTMVPTEVLTEIAKASGAPVYTYADATIGSGVVGGAMWRHDNEAVQTARLAVRVLRGATGAALPAVEDAPTPYMADWRELQRFGLDERRLPPGTAVLHRAPGVWERYRGIALATFAVVLLEALLIGLLLDERRRRLRAQHAIADQARYEHMLAHLMTDAARYAPLATPGALEDALGRIGRYAGADDVVLLQHSTIASRPPTRLQWHRWKSSASAQPTDASASAENGRTLEFPLVVADRSLGVLKLSRAGSATPWPPQLMERLAAAADVLAVAITRLAATQRAEEAAHQVAHIGRVAMIGELASTISHELRQPLAAILINGETGKQLLARKPDAPMLGRVFDDIIADTNRATGVIEHIRSLLRNEVLPNAMIDINAICREAVELLRHDALKRGIQLDVSFDSRLSPVAGQPIELQQVVLNLLLNAFDAVMSGPERSVAIRTSALERSVQIMVRDSGPGLSTEASHHVFESFFTTKAQGLGMGLAIVRSIVERHRGRIQLETGEQRGAIFRVILPAIDVPATEPAPRRDLVEASG